MFEFKLLDSGLIWGDGSTLDSNFTFFDCFGSIKGNLIVGLITMLDSKVEVLDGEMKEGENEIIFDGFPDDSGHLITIEFDDGIRDMDFRKLHVKC